VWLALTDGAFGCGEYKPPMPHAAKPPAGKSRFPQRRAADKHRFIAVAGFVVTGQFYNIRIRRWARRRHLCRLRA